MNYIEEKDAFEKFKEIVYELYPIKKPRMELEEEYIPTRNTSLRVVVWLFKDAKGIVRTQMTFTKDYDGIYKFFYIDNKLSNDTVGKIMSFIFNEFPYVNSVQTSSIGFDIESVIGLEHFEQEGISCRKINIVFNTIITLAHEFNYMFEEYLNYILSNYIEYMRRAPQIKEVYKKYRTGIKKEIVNSLTRVELERFIGLLSDEELRDLLIGMNTDKFFKTCDEFDKDMNQPKSLRLINGTPKKIVNNK